MRYASTWNDVAVVDTNKWNEPPWFTLTWSANPSMAPSLTSPTSFQPSVPGLAFSAVTHPAVVPPGRLSPATGPFAAGGVTPEFPVALACRLATGADPQDK